MKLLQLAFTNAQTSDSYNFLTDQHRVREFAPAYDIRGEARPRMQMPGSHPRVPYAGELPVHQEGLILGSSDGDLVNERDVLVGALLGDLSAAATARASGTLTVEYVSWGEAASGDVLIESFEPPKLDFESVRTAAYMLVWILPIPYLVGESSGNPRYL